MDQTAQKEFHGPSDSPSLSEDTKKTPVSPFSLDSAEGIPPKDEITSSTSSKEAADNQGHSLITPSLNYASLDSTDGIPPKDKITRSTSSKEAADTQGYSLITPSLNYTSSDSADDIPHKDEFNITNSSNGSLGILSYSHVTHIPNFPRGIRRNTINTLMLGCADKYRICVDSGANYHAFGNRNLISEWIRDKPQIVITMVDGNTLYSHGCGHVNTKDYTLANVYYVPGLEDMNVVSVSQLNDLDYSVEFTGKACIIKDCLNNTEVARVTRGAQGLFELDSLRVPLDRIGCA